MGSVGSVFSFEDGNEIVFFESDVGSVSGVQDRRNPDRALATLSTR